MTERSEVAAVTERSEAQLVVLVGHPRPGSRTHGVAAQAGRRLRAALATQHVPVTEPTLVDLAELAPYLLDRRANGVADVAVRTVSRAAVLVAASPTFRAAYSGLLKLFLDLLPRDGLDTTVALPLMTAGLPAHREAVDATLRPVLLELGAHVPTRGIGVLEVELDRFDELFDAWWSEQGGRLVGAVAARTGLALGEAHHGRGFEDAQWSSAVACRAGGQVPA